MADANGRLDAAELVLEDRFAMVPEWVLDAEISDCAVRLYAVLLRYGYSTGARMPGRATLARRLHKRSTDTVDRALKELVALGAVVVEHRFEGRQRLTNRYRVRTSAPGRTDAATPAPDRGGRMDAATPRDAGGPGRTDAARGGRTDAAGVAARIGHDREHLTESTPPPPPSPSGPDAWIAQQRRLVADCGIEDWIGFVATVRDRRRAAGGSLTRWAEAHLLSALHLAVRNRDWPAEQAARALLAVAADPESRSPVRVAEAGPWWDEPQPAGSEAREEIAALEADLEAADGLRVLLQQQAREQLAAEGVPATRSTVARRAHELLRRRAAREAVPAC